MKAMSPGALLSMKVSRLQRGHRYVYLEPATFAIVLALGASARRQTGAWPPVELAGVRLCYR